MNRVSIRPAIPFLSFTNFCQLVNYHTGESKALQPRQRPVAGKWCKLPTSHQPPLCQSTSTLTCSHPLPPPGPLPWGWGAPGLPSCVLQCSTKYLPGNKKYFCFQKVFNEKVNAYLKNNAKWPKASQSPGQITLNSSEVRNAIYQKPEEGVM